MAQTNGSVELREWLTARGIDLTGWGAGNAKGVDDLAAEISSGESRLLEQPVQRLVSVVRVQVEQNKRRLIEGMQELANGQRRERNLPPSEKMKRDEDVETAVYRCLREELGLASEQVEIQLDGLRTFETMIESPSYPTLPTRYQIYEVTAVVHGLPTTNFWKKNAAHESGDPVRRHFWVWQ